MPEIFEDEELFRVGNTSKNSSIMLSLWDMLAVKWNPAALKIDVVERSNLQRQLNSSGRFIWATRGANTSLHPEASKQASKSTPIPEHQKLEYQQLASLRSSHVTWVHYPAMVQPCKRPRSVFWTGCVVTGPCLVLLPWGWEYLREFGIIRFATPPRIHRGGLMGRMRSAVNLLAGKLYLWHLQKPFQL
jgi:hypothetical protein